MQLVQERMHFFTQTSNTDKCRRVTSGLSGTQGLFWMVGQGRGVMVAVPTVPAASHTEA